MTVLVQTVRQISNGAGVNNSQIVHRIAPLAILVALISVIPDGWSTALDALSEAYLAVSVFVAGTLALVYAAERGFKTDLGDLLIRHRHWQVPAGALLGAFPGCGGAIVAITQYTRGYLSFGGVVATLMATMGDAMFLLLAREAMTALAVLVTGVVVGVAAGYLVDAIHGPDFMRPEQVNTFGNTSATTSELTPSWSLAEKGWVATVIPGVVIGVMAAFQVDFDQVITPVIEVEVAYWLGVFGAVLAIAMWVNNGDDVESSHCVSGETCQVESKPVVTKVIDDTNFITTWVVFAFIGYELLVSSFGVDLGASLTVWAPLVPATAILIGFIPGCGPQILVTSLYVTGAIPLSAQLGNAIANDGDALFPAIAVAPMAAVVATVYSAIPAILVAYGWYLFME